MVPAQLEGLLDWLGVGDGGNGDRRRPRAQRRAAADGGRTRAVAGGARPAGRGVRAGARVRPALRVAHRAGAAAAGARLRHRGRGARPGGAAGRGRGPGRIGRGRGRARRLRRARPRRATRLRGRSRRGRACDGGARGGELVITDSNRRRIVSPSRPRQTWGRTLEADEDIPVDAPQLETFGDQDADEQTVAVLTGAESLRSPFASGFPQFPEHRPYAAFDGDTDTWWEADRELRGPNRWVEVRFGAPRDVPSIEVLPRRQDATVVTEVEVAGRRFALEPGWNRLELGLPDVDRLRVRITGRDLPEGRRGGPGALAEIRVPGLHVQEQLRPPRTLERAMAGPDLTDVRGHVSLRARDRRPAVPAPARHRPGCCRGAGRALGRAGADPRGGRRRARHRARDRAGAGARVRRGRVGVRGRRRARPGARPARRLPRAAGVHVVEPLRGPSWRPRFERVRRRSGRPRGSAAPSAGPVRGSSGVRRRARPSSRCGCASQCRRRGCRAAFACGPAARQARRSRSVPTAPSGCRGRSRGASSGSRS